MKLNYTDIETCPVVIDITVSELRTLVKITKETDDPSAKRIHEELVDIYSGSVASGTRRFKFESLHYLADLGIKTDEDA